MNECREGEEEKRRWDDEVEVSSGDGDFSRPTPVAQPGQNHVIVSAKIRFFGSGGASWGAAKLGLRLHTWGRSRLILKLFKILIQPSVCMFNA